MEDTGGSQGEGLVETTQRQNYNLQRLIEAVGTLLAGSHELLKRLQPVERARGQTARRHPPGCRSTAFRPGETLTSEKLTLGRNCLLDSAFGCEATCIRLPPPG